MTATTDLTARRLRVLAKDWPREDCWIWSADGRLYLMQLKDGERVMDGGVGVDRAYTMESFNIPADGGDW